MTKIVVFIFSFLYTFSLSAQVDSVPLNIKNEGGHHPGLQKSAIQKKDTNTVTIINITRPNSKNTKSLVKTKEEKSTDDVKTSIVKAKQNSRHWFDALYVNLICAGINKFVKKD